jgi:DNA-binding HxlR family transcriptional regulator
VPDRSPLDEALRRVGDRWTLHIVSALLPGPLRFGELAERVEGIAPNTLTDRLRHLEGEALVVARPYSDRPARFEYELSAEGRELAGALRLLEQWGAGQLAAGAPVHDACGTPLELRWWCPDCGVAVDADDDGAEYV